MDNNIPTADYFISNPKGHLLESHVRKNFPIFYSILMKYPKDLKFSERIYWYFHNIHERPKCIHCGKGSPKFISFTFGYLQYCSYTCSNESSLRTDKIRQTSLDRYGVENASQVESIKLKKYATARKHYGVDHPLQSTVVKEKQKQTLLERYGVENAFQIHPEYAYIKYYEKFKQENPLIDDIRKTENGIEYICSCPNPDCHKCNDRKFVINNKQYNSRKYNHVELCTNLLPIQYDRISNTTIEQFVKDILDKHSIDYITNDRTVLSGKELDIHIPSRRLAVECNGIYWHSLKGPKYHHEKWSACKEQGIQLLTLWEDQIVNKPEVVKNILLSRLGIYEERIGASKCKVLPVSSKESMEFLDRNHLQGPVNGSIRLGLYYKDRLVSLMVFGRKRKALGSDNKENTYELYRYCNTCGVQVVHGAERLFKHFMTDHPGCTVESFSSNDISNGALYEALGFVHVGDQQASYWYVDKNLQRHHRYSFRKDVLVRNGADPNMTEAEITSGLGLLRIYDSGQQLWRF